MGANSTTMLVLTVLATSSASWLASHSRLSPVMLEDTGKVRVETVMNSELRLSFSIFSRTPVLMSSPFLLEFKQAVQLLLLLLGEELGGAQLVETIREWLAHSAGQVGGREQRAGESEIVC